MLGWVGLFAVVGGIMVYLSRDQPFPEISRNHGMLLLATAGLLLIAGNSPRQFEQVRIAAYAATAVGGFQVIAGVRHMATTYRDVIVAPLSGIVLTCGGIGLLIIDWQRYSSTEQIGAFSLAAILVLLELYLFFRGMIVGTTARSWSAAGLRQLERGLVAGQRGAIACFERAWDEEQEYISAMSHAALYRIHTHLQNSEAADQSWQRLQRMGGEESVDDAWLKAIGKALPAEKRSSEEE